MRMLAQDALDLGGRDVLASADDRVVGAPADEQVALLVEVSNILGGKPAVRIEHRSDPGVAARHLLPADEELAGFARAQHGSVLCPDLHLNGGDGLTDGTEPSRDGL